MRLLFPALFALLSIVSGALADPPQEKTAASTARQRIGLYDSRAVAVAYAGTPAHEARLRRLSERREQAKKAGNLAEVAKIEAEGRALQRQAHQQAFGTAPVDDILALLGDAVPEIRKETGVTVLLSKWDEAGLKKYPEAERVDVTLRLIDALHPNERQRRSAIEIQKHAPIASEQAATAAD